MGLAGGRGEGSRPFSEIGGSLRPSSAEIVVAWWALEEYVHLFGRWARAALSSGVHTDSMLGKVGTTTVHSEAHDSLNVSPGWKLTGEHKYQHQN